MSNETPTLPQLIQTTKRLQRQLSTLIKKYPEKHLELGARVVDRMMSNRWRHMGEAHIACEKKPIDAIDWRELATNYFRQLQAYFSSHVALAVAWAWKTVSTTPSVACPAASAKP